MALASRWKEPQGLRNTWCCVPTASLFRENGRSSPFAKPLLKERPSGKPFYETCMIEDWSAMAWP
jgi:hypothetical protein